MSKKNDLYRILLIAILASLTIACESSSDPDDDYPPIDTTKVIEDLCFERHVLPILRSSCAISGCHDAQTAAHEVVLDSWESIMIRSEDHLVTPYDPRESELYEVLVEDDDDERMPPLPMGALTERQIGIIRQWIQEGALNEECEQAPCDTVEVSWPVVRLILQDNCWGCHSNAVAGAGIRALEDYEDVVEEIRDGDLIPSIERSPGALAMPPFVELDSCSIAVIKAWRDQGYRQ